MTRGIITSLTTLASANAAAMLLGVGIDEGKGTIIACSLLGLLGTLVSGLYMVSVEPERRNRYVYKH